MVGSLLYTNGCDGSTADVAAPHASHSLVHEHLYLLIAPIPLHTYTKIKVLARAHVPLLCKSISTTLTL